MGTAVSGVGLYPESNLIGKQMGTGEKRYMKGMEHFAPVPRCLKWLFFLV